MLNWRFGFCFNSCILSVSVLYFPSLLRKLLRCWGWNSPSSNIFWLRNPSYSLDSEPFSGNEWRSRSHNLDPGLVGRLGMSTLPLPTEQMAGVPLCLHCFVASLWKPEVIGMLELQPLVSFFYRFRLIKMKKMEGKVQNLRCRHGPDGFDCHSCSLGSKPE